MRKPNVFAVAARNMERQKKVECGDTVVSDYPCFYVVRATGKRIGEWNRAYEVEVFLNAFSNRIAVYDMSNDFINQTDNLDRNVCITALCFAAAMLDAGDL